MSSVKTTLLALLVMVAVLPTLRGLGQPPQAPAPLTRSPELDAEITKRLGGPVFWADDLPKRWQEVEQIIDRPLHQEGLEFQDESLSEVLRYIRQEYKLEIRLDLDALDDLGLSPDDPVTIDQQRVTLRSALRHLLRQLDLTFLVENSGVLVVTSEDEALSQLKVIVYPTGDIIEPMQVDDGQLASDAQGNPKLPIQVLQEIVVANCNVDGWLYNGHPGLIRYAKPNLIIVSNTYEVHQQVQSLLQAIRKAQQHEYAQPSRIGPQARLPSQGFDEDDTAYQARLRRIAPTARDLRDEASAPPQ
ncbi:glycosyltransferase family 1 protein [Aeoliella mucimassa]|uniref:Uncharacterized protein n=1 Tax=Aeoliella mucimassa TaxID=2527972 RepID=A0A518AHK3_9BACT|nr:glycosyltransferase family 1 protein [Aeoliella mucimassa]QDU54209.1 hypothetical protein Pan181_03890 [Aeoliella mucimassa]